MRVHTLGLLATFLPLFTACHSDSTGPAPDAAVSAAASGYIAVDLGTLGGTYSEALGINHWGQIVGQSSTAAGGSPHAFIWQNGTMTDLGTLDPHYQYTDAVAINRAGKVVGSSQTASGEEHAFTWKKGVMTDLGPYPGADHSFAADVNRIGQVLSPHAWLWTGGVWQTLPALAFSNAINDSGWVVGGDWVAFGGDGSSYSRAILLKKGKVKYLTKLAGETNSSVPLDINNVGQMVGQCQNRWGRSRAVLWNKFGRITNLGTLGGNESFATALNDAGVIVGRSRTATRDVRPFVWRDGVMADLGTLGGSHGRAEDINDAGWIVGASARADGTVHATLWRPQ